MIHGIFKKADSKTFMSGYATVPYSSDAGDETVVETTEDDLATIFENAKANGGTLDGSDETIEAAIDDPLGFIDYLILDSEGAISFDDGHVREDSDTSPSA